MAFKIENDFKDLNWEEILLNTNFQTGGLLVGYSGVPFQRGHGLGSFFKALFKVGAPIAKKVIKNVAKEGISTMASVGSDLLAGRNFKESLKEHGKASTRKLAKKGVKAVKKKLRNQKGGQIGYRKKNSTRKTIERAAKPRIDRKKRKGVLKTDLLGNYYQKK